MNGNDVVLVTDLSGPTQLGLFDRLEQIIYAIGTVMLIVAPMLFVYWIFLLLRKYDFRQKPALGWFLLVFFFVIVIICLGYLMIANVCYTACSSDHQARTIILTLVGMGAILLYTLLAIPTYKRLRRNT